MFGNRDRGEVQYQPPPDYGSLQRIVDQLSEDPDQQDPDSRPTWPRIGVAGDREPDGDLDVDSTPRVQSCPVVPQVTIEAVDYRQRIIGVCDGLKAFLLEKNLSYGNSAFEPINIFSKLEAREGILIRIDDKLKRIKNGKSYPGDNDVKDLTGYLILLMTLEAS